MFISFKRILKAGGVAFIRNFGLSIAEILIIMMVVFLVTFIFAFNKSSEILISSIEKKVDISVYFKKDVAPNDIYIAQADLAKIPEVKDVQYISKEQALNDFIERYEQDPVLMDSLKEIGENPFLAQLSIVARKPSQYEQIQKFLEASSYNNLMEKIDYFQRKPVIDKIFLTVSRINRGAIIFATALIIIAFLVALNTIRIAIHNLCEEISTMRLVGASNWFIRGPFLTQGLICGLIAALLAFLTTYAVFFAISSTIKTIAFEIDLFGLFISNFFVILLIQFGIGISLGVVSSFVAVRKYLKI